MVCTRGKASPNQQVKLQLFADSGGFCQNPACTKNLFVDIEEKNLNIAEVAHICAASETGPRADTKMSSTDRGAYENLILLCPTCHTIVDKAPEKFTDIQLISWKCNHKKRITEVFQIVECEGRSEVRKKIDPLMLLNLGIFTSSGPSEIHMENPESPVAPVWKKKLLTQILPNNRKILAILDANRNHLNETELSTLEKYRQHVIDLENKHIGDGVRTVSSRFPKEMNQILKDEP